MKLVKMAVGGLLIAGLGGVAVVAQTKHTQKTSLAEAYQIIKSNITIQWIFQSNHWLYPLRGR